MSKTKEKKQPTKNQKVAKGALLLHILQIVQLIKEELSKQNKTF